MILKDLIKEISFVEVKKKFPKLYPEQKRSLPGYERVYKLLLKKRVTKSTTIIDIRWVEDKDCDGGGYWDIYGKEPNDDQRWALDFSSFSRWLGFTIGPELLTEDKVTFLCHVLWEMTFHGFSDKDIKKIVRQMEHP